MPRRRKDLEINGESFPFFTPIEWSLMRVLINLGDAGGFGAELAGLIEESADTNRRPDIDPSTFYKTMRRLHQMGMIERTGKTKTTKTGATRIWWRVTAEGYRAFAANFNIRDAKSGMAVGKPIDVSRGL